MPKTKVKQSELERAKEVWARIAESQRARVIYDDIVDSYELRKGEFEILEKAEADGIDLTLVGIPKNWREDFN